MSRTTSSLKRPQALTLPRAAHSVRGLVSRNALAPAEPGVSPVYSILAQVQSGNMGLHEAARSIIDANGGLQVLRPPKPPIGILDACNVPAHQVAEEMKGMAQFHHKVAARNATAELYAAMRNLLPGVQFHAGAQMLLYSDPDVDVPMPQKLPGRVAVVCGIGNDLKIAYEAKLALELSGAYVTMLHSITASNLASVVQAKQRVDGADVLIVCCAEQPALGSLLAVVTDAPVIAVPGIGCPDPTEALPAPGVMTVAPGDGVSAGAAAVRMLRIAANYIQYRKDRDVAFGSAQQGGSERSSQMRPALNRGGGSPLPSPLREGTNGSVAVREGTLPGRAAMSNGVRVH